MRLRLDAEPEELAANGDRLITVLARALEEHNPDLSEALHKSAAAPAVELPDGVVRGLRDEFLERYRVQMVAMTRAIGKVLDRSVGEVAKSEGGADPWDESQHPRAPNEQDL